MSHPAQRAMSSLCLIAAIAAPPVSAQDLSALTGTLGIEAHRIASSGRFAGCALNFRATTQDFAYRQGALVAANGSFNLNLLNESGQQTLGPLLKVGTRQMIPESTGQFEAPTFAYMQSANGSTANSVLGNMASDMPGFRVYALRSDKELLRLVGDILEGAPVTLYFNRTSNGMDVKVPLDFRVIDSKATPRGIEGIYSDATLVAFRACFSELADALK